MVNLFNVKTTTTKLCVKRSGSNATDFGFLKRVKCSKHTVHFAFGFILLLFECALFGFAYWADMSLPTARMKREDSSHFLSGAAMEHLKALTEIGPKVIGSNANEIEAVNYLQTQINQIISMRPNHIIEMDIQKASGAFFYDYKPYGMMNVYDEIQNVIVKMYSENPSAESLLINCHYDTVPNSPGGSDDGISCVTMLEVLNVLSSRNKRPAKNIIFLFNGAEEYALQGSHAFITQHRWKDEVRIVINMDTLGAGGRELLFQIGPGDSWLTNYYSKVPHPNAQVAGEEVFQSDLIPSDTDMRVFKKFANLTGLDIAFTQNGYVYHTKYDNMDAISEGTFQHVGDNLLTLVEELSNAPEMEYPVMNEDEKSVYYDIFGLFLIHYTETVGIVINSITIILSCVMLVIGMKDIGIGIFMKHLLLSEAAIVAGWIVAICFGLLVAVIMDWWNCSMSWFGEQWLIFGLYTFPTVGIMCLGLLAVNYLKPQKTICLLGRTHAQLHANRMIWTLVLLVLTAMGIRSSYILMVPILFNTVIYIGMFIFKIQGTGILWTIVYLIGMIIPTILCLYQIRITLAIFIPIFGRSGTDQNPEIFASLLSVCFTIIVASFYVPLVTLLRKPFYFIAGIFIIFIITIIVILTPAGFPYSNNDNAPRPQRFQIWHTQRSFYDENQSLINTDHGYLLLNMDRNSPRTIEDYVPELQNVESVIDHCDSRLFCGVPILESGQISKIESSSWIRADAPILTFPTVLNLIERNENLNGIVRYNFTVTGPSFLAVFLSPKENCKLDGWFFSGEQTKTEIPESEYVRNDRTTYIIAFGSGKSESSYDVSFDISGGEECRSNPYFIDIVLSGKYIDKSLHANTKEFNQFLDQFPEWAHVIEWTATYDSYRFK